MGNFPYKRPGTQLDDFRETIIEFQIAVEQDIRSAQGQINKLVVKGDSSPQAAAAAIDIFGNDHQTLKGRLDNEQKTRIQEKEEIDTALEEKATTEDIINLDKKIEKQASGSPKGVYPTLAALKTAFPLGNENIYLVSADGKWYYWNDTTWTPGGTYQSALIPEKSITPLHIDMRISEYLGEDLATGNLIPDKYVNNLSGQEASYPNTTTGGVTIFLPVTPGKKYRYFGYTKMPGYVGSYYDNNKIYRGPLVSPENDNSAAEMVMPANAAFIRVNYAKVTQAQFFVKEVLSQNFSPAWLEIGTKNIKKEAVIKENLSPELQTALNNPNIPDRSIEIIKLTESAERELRNTGIEPGSITLESLSQSVKDFIAEPSSDPVNPYDGKTSGWTGDSTLQGTGTTAANKRFANIVVERLSMSQSGYQNLGVGGSTIARQGADWTIKSYVQRICDEKQMSAGKDYIFIVGGGNDYVRNTPLSTMDEALEYFKTNGAWEDTTFYGALNRLITFFRDNHNDSKLLYITPFHWETENKVNTVGLKLVDYVKAIREVCSYYGVTVIDLWNNLPIDPKNSGHKAKYTMNGSLTGPDGIHLNDLGNEIEAKLVINFLKYQYIV